MNVMVIGGGGREHAIIRTLRATSPAVDQIYALPGNGGIALDAVCVPIDAKDIPGQVAFAQSHAIDYAIVTPDDPLALGAVDALQAAGIPCFGPNQAAARLESSKVFAKDFMRRHGIPTADYAVFDSPAAALQYIDSAAMPAVIKADGLALGKGVTIAMTREDAREAVRRAMEERVFGEAGAKIVIEEYLTGPEVSVLSFTDGETIVPMVSSMDHKRAYDGDQGPNTGGMGTIAPNPYYTPAIAERCMQEIFLPTIRAMAAEGHPFRGCLYFGLMLTERGPRVIEYNCRFGDPETQVVLPLLQGDLLRIMQATTNGTLRDTPIAFSSDSACCVVMASDGYPGKYQTGYEISMGDDARAHTYVAGAKREGDKLLTAGGRVLGVTATAPTLSEAIQAAYARVSEIRFANAVYRQDIGQRALQAVRV